jgi:hypothetical protein
MSAIISEGLVVRPGDSLVVLVSLDNSLESDDFQLLQRQIQASLPEGAKVVVVTLDGTMAVVRTDK